MTIARKVELGLIPVVTGGLWVIAPALPDKTNVGKLLLGASALLLLQSLIRDLWLLQSARLEAKTTSPRVARCMCIESTVGITGIVIGLLLLIYGSDKQVKMESLRWSLFAMLVLGAGFLIKDYVLELKPLRIRKDKNHLNIVVKWKV